MKNGREWRPEYLTIKSAANYLSMSERTVHTLLKDWVDPIPHFRRGRLIRIKRSDLDEWMRRHLEADNSEINNIVDGILKGKGNKSK